MTEDPSCCCTMAGNDVRYCRLIGAGDCERLEPAGPGDLVIAVDGGLLHAQRLGVRADLAVGDFDSLGYVPQGIPVFRHPVIKDDTDMMLAVRLGLERGYRRFLIYGGLGGRLDHTLANLQTLAFVSRAGAAGVLVGDGYCLTVLGDGCEARFGAEAKGTVSVFSLAEESRGVDEEGLLYTLSEGTLRVDFPLGVSNEFTGRPALVRVWQGMLAVYWQGPRTWLGTIEKSDAAGERRV